MSRRLTAEDVTTVDSVSDRLGYVGREEVIRLAIGLLAWAQRETSAGKCIASIDHKANTVREYVMPWERRGGTQ